MHKKAAWRLDAHMQWWGHKLHSSHKVFQGGLRGTVVEHQSVTGELSLSYAW